MIYFGDNSDQYTKQDKIWHVAKRHNQQSKELNGHVTVVRRRKVKSVKRVGVL